MTIKAQADISLNSVSDIKETVDGAASDLLNVSDALSAQDDAMDTITNTVDINKALADKSTEDLQTQITDNKSSGDAATADVQNNVDALQASTDGAFDALNKYIRYSDGKLILGDVDSDVVLQLYNERISFMKGSQEVAYFANNKLYVTDGEFLSTLRLGKFAFVPRLTGNLSFRKVSD